MSRHHAALSGSRWEATRLAVFDRDGWRCWTCGAPGALEGHHREALADGGAEYDLDNVVTLCRSCHIEHHRTGADPEREAWALTLWDLAGGPDMAPESP